MDQDADEDSDVVIMEDEEDDEDDDDDGNGSPELRPQPSHSLRPQLSKYGKCGESNGPFKVRLNAHLAGNGMTDDQLDALNEWMDSNTYDAISLFLNPFLNPFLNSVFVDDMVYYTLCLHLLDMIQMPLYRISNVHI